MTQEQYNACRTAIQALDEALNNRWAAEFAERTWGEEVNQATRLATLSIQALKANWFELQEDKVTHAQNP